MKIVTLTKIGQPDNNVAINCKWVVDKQDWDMTGVIVRQVDQQWTSPTATLKLTIEDPQTGTEISCKRQMDLNGQFTEEQVIDAMIVTLYTQYNIDIIEIKTLLGQIKTKTADCEICGKNTGITPEMCCSGSATMECGCMGQPINGPMVCSNECYDKLINKAAK